MLSQVGRLQEEAERRESESRQATLAHLKLEEVLAEKSEWEHERIGLLSKLRGMERELASARGEERVEVELTRGTACHAEQAAWEGEKASLLSKVKLLQEERCRLVESQETRLRSCTAELARQVEEAKSDGVAESEILQARISELTEEKAGMEATCRRLQEGMSELTEEKAGMEATCRRLQEGMAELTEEKAGSRRLQEGMAELTEEKAGMEATCRRLQEDIQQLMVQAEQKGVVVVVVVVVVAVSQYDGMNCFRGGKAASGEVLEAGAEVC